MVAVVLARLGTMTVISPLELVQTKLQAQHVSYRELACVMPVSVLPGLRAAGAHCGCSGVLRPFGICPFQRCSGLTMSWRGAG